MRRVISCSKKENIRFLMLWFAFLLIFSAVVFWVWLPRSQISGIFEHEVNDRASYFDVQKSMNEVPPEVLARVSFGKGDLRFVAYRGYMVVAPGASASDIDLYGVKVIARTGDMVVESEFYEFMKKAVVFSERYNQEINSLRAASE